MAEWFSFYGPPCILWDTHIMCYPPLTPLPASMADGEAIGANTGHYKRVERKPKDA